MHSDEWPLDEARAIMGLRTPGVTSVHKAVLYALLLHTNKETGLCFPSYATIAEDAGCSPRCAKTAVARLSKNTPYLTVTKRRVDGKKESESNLYVVHVVHNVVHQVHKGGEPRAPQVVHQDHQGGAPRAQELQKELQTGTTDRAAVAAPLVLVGDPKPERGKKAPKHSPEVISAKEKIVEAFIKAFTARKGVAPKVTHQGDHAAAFQLAKTYGAEEGCSIVRRALQDPFVSNSNATLRYIASKADSFRGAAATKKYPGRVPPQVSVGKYPIEEVPYT